MTTFLKSPQCAQCLSIFFALFLVSLVICTFGEDSTRGSDYDNLSDIKTTQVSELHPEDSVGSPLAKKVHKLQ